MFIQLKKKTVGDGEVKGGEGGYYKEINLGSTPDTRVMGPVRFFTLNIYVLWQSIKSSWSCIYPSHIFSSVLLTTKVTNPLLVRWGRRLTILSLTSLSALSSYMSIKNMAMRVSAGVFHEMMITCLRSSNQYHSRSKYTMINSDTVCPTSSSTSTAKNY